MADAGYDAEVSGIQAFLSMQHDKGDATPLSPGQVCINSCTTWESHVSCIVISQKSKNEI